MEEDNTNETSDTAQESSVAISEPVEIPEGLSREESPEDVENGLRFLHEMVMQTKSHLVQLTATVNAMAETLITSGQMPLDAYQQRRHLTVVRENQRAESEDTLVQIGDVEDKYTLEGLPDIDCEARMHLCRGRCCSYVFPLTVQDLNERVVRWEYARPYQIAHAENGYCVHNEEGTHRCTVYKHRPATCRTYDCRKDERVWIDFEKRIPRPLSDLRYPPPTSLVPARWAIWKLV
jgi:Fe-S-cluster containining protein